MKRLSELERLLVPLGLLLVVGGAATISGLTTRIPSSPYRGPIGIPYSKGFGTQVDYGEPLPHSKGEARF